jgi:hypothetical protein
MAESGNISYTLGALTVKGPSNLNSIQLTSKSSITQGTSLTTGVTINSPCGFITTVNTTFSTGGSALATRGSAAFTVNNVHVRSDSIVHSNIVDFNGAGIINMRVGAIADGSFSINLRNADSIDAATGTIKIAFSVL